MAEVREAAVAGTFYQGSPVSLRRQVEGLFTHHLGPGQVPTIGGGPRGVVGLISPHAGYVYSGPVAAHAYAALAADGVPEVAVIVGPNHHGFGAAVAVSSADFWQTPLGTLRVEGAVRESLVKELPDQSRADFAHQNEHSVEVQLPFLQVLYGERLAIVPIAMRDQSMEAASTLARALAEALAGRDAVIIASTDLSHYESQAVANLVDRLAIDAMLAGDAAQLVDVARHRTSMCGPGPVAATMLACQALGARQVELLSYATSGDVAGDKRQVVGYAALAFRREITPPPAAGLSI